MIDNLIAFSIRNKLVVGFFVIALMIWGGYALKHIPIDAVPDITNNQVQIITQTPNLAPQEVEQYVTFPIEIALSNLPDVVEIRSISRFGLSVVTVVFEEDMDIYLARQLISEQLKSAIDEIPEGFGRPELGPISTGLGEVYQYVLTTEPGFEDQYSDMDLRTINDWIVKRQLAGTPGVIEVSGWGGQKKQYEVAVNSSQLQSLNVSVTEVFEALRKNNANTGGSYIEKQYNTYFIRGEGLVKSFSDIEKIAVKTVNNIPILIKDVAKVGYGSAPRYGAITYNGKGEVVGGQTLMLKGENSNEVVEAVKSRIEEIKKSLPEGVRIQPYLDRSELIGRAISTVSRNLIEGGLIVIFVLVLLLGNFRGGLIVASVIPLSMLFALGMMHLFGVSANLMSLGALDFGLVVDGSVIIVEAILLRLTTKFAGQKLDASQMDHAVGGAATKIRSSAAFGEIIILIVYLPILALVGIEGKMFGPMAKTVVFAIGGALILSMTYVPMMSALFLNKKVSHGHGISEKIINRLQSIYYPSLQFALRNKAMVIVVAVVLFGMSLFTFSRMGGEFIPTLDEGDFALHQILPPGSSLQQSVEVSKKIQDMLLSEFEEVESVVSKIGTAEIPTDPMPIEVGDIMVRMKPPSEWVNAKTKDEMFEKMEAVLSKIPGVQYEFTQPIQMRFNELMAGVREDIAIKIFGENPKVLHNLAKEAEGLIQNIEGIGDLRVEQTQGLPQMIVRYDRQKLGQYGIHIDDVNLILRAAFAGETAGVVFEDERRFDLVVRLDQAHRQNIDDIKNLFVPLPNGNQIPMSEIASIEFEDGPTQISREDAKRRIVIGVNARNRDTEGLVAEIDQVLNDNLTLPEGYSLHYGGQFENLVAAKSRLSVAVPAALLLILVLLFITFNSLKQALLIFTAIPLSAIGGVYALWIRDMPFSISAGVGFIALSGVAVLNGIVLIAYFNQLKEEGVLDIRERVMLGAKVRLRPVIITAAVAALGFLPMALSNSAGAEVQRPLATVVIGGLISATLLTLLLLPVLYTLLETMKIKLKKGKIIGAVLLLMGLSFAPALSAQEQAVLTLDEAVGLALEKHPLSKSAALSLENAEVKAKNPIDLDQTHVTYSFGQLNSSRQDYQWQISQSFKFPTVYHTQSKLLKAELELSKTSRDLTLLELEKRVRSAWWNLVYVKSIKSTYSKILALYSDFDQVAEKRFDAGDINILERTTAKGRKEEIKFLLAQADSDLLLAESILKNWLMLEKLPDLEDSLVSIPRTELQLDLTPQNTPFSAYYTQSTQIAEQQKSLAKSGFLPNFSVGYINQQIEGTEGLTGVQVGVGIPLFFWTQKSKVKSAQIALSQSQEELLANNLQLETELEKTQQEVLKYALQMDWFQTQGIPTADELTRFSEKAYKAGEIDYVEFISANSQALDIRLNSLQTINLYNQAATQLNYLTGSFSN
jgi:heavy metal efflux system protein